jgi:hypothetical protein
MVLYFVKLWSLKYSITRRKWLHRIGLFHTYLFGNLQQGCYTRSIVVDTPCSTGRIVMCAHDHYSVISGPCIFSFQHADNVFTSQRLMGEWNKIRLKGAVTLSNLSRNLSRNVKKNDFRIALQGMLHQAICSTQLQMIIIKNSIKTAANVSVWRHIVSQKPIGSHSVCKYCETSCKRDVTLCNALKMRCTVAKSRTWFYFVQWLLQQKYCETCWLRGMIHFAISRATCVATKLRDKLRDKLHSVYNSAF